MKQWIIDRYNKGQSEWIVDDEDVIDKSGNIAIRPNTENNALDLNVISLYDFLFNPKWGFAKAFWKGLKDVKLVSDTGKEIIIRGWEWKLQVMAISENPLEYLEQFKEVA